MPVHTCQENGKQGWKWGSKGKCYTYTKGDKEGSKRARAKAERQGRAARAGGYQGSLDLLIETLDNIYKSLYKLRNML